MGNDYSLFLYNGKYVASNFEPTGWQFQNRGGTFSKHKGYTEELTATGCCKSQKFAWVSKSNWTKS